MAKKLLNREQIAGLLEISQTRVAQLVGLGVLVRRPEGFDPLECALGLLKFMRRDEEARAARTRLINANASVSERRQRQALTQLLTIDEVHCVLMDAFGGLMGALQAATSVMYSEEAAEAAGEQQARSRTTRVYERVRGTLIAFRDASARACSEIKQGLHSGERLDRVVAELVRAVSPADDADDDADDADDDDAEVGEDAGEG